MRNHCCKTDACRIKDLEAERDALKESMGNHIAVKNDAIAEVNRCHAEIDRLKEELERWKSERFHADDLALAWKSKAEKLAEALRDLKYQTRSDGVWADQAVYSYIEGFLAEFGKGI